MLRQGQPTQSGDQHPGEAQAHLGDLSSGLKQFVSILLENYKLILAVGLAGLVLGIASALVSTPLYRATALIQFDPGAADMLDTGKSAASQSRRTTSSQEGVATQIGLFHSESLARRVAQDLNLASDPAYGGENGTLAQRTDRATSRVLAATTAEPVRGSTLIRVSAVSGDPVMAAQIANALVRGQMSATIARRFDTTSYARTFLSDQLTRTKSALEESERNLNNYAINAGIFRGSTRNASGQEIDGASLAQGDLGKLNDALKQAEIDRIAAEQRYRESEIGFSSEVAANVGPMVLQRSDLQAQYEEKLKIYKPDYPAMIELKARIDRLDAAINAERKRANSNKRTELYGEYKAAVRIEAELRVAVAEAKGEVLRDRTRSIQYNILQRETDTNRALYDALLQRYKEVGVAGGIGQSDISLVDEAKPAKGPFSPRPMISAILGLLVGMAIGTGLALVLQLLFDSIADSRDVRAKLHLPVLGTIPIEADGRSPSEALVDTKSELSEAYHSVRTALKFARPEGLPRTLLVTSTRPGEGKSTSAFAIATSVARLGSKVLLVDADLRKPTFASNRKNGLGLGHLLNSEDDLASCIEKTRAENLSLLPVGRFTGSAAELLSSNRLPLLIRDAAEQFDMVVIDAPPVLGLADAPLLASVADATALVIESRGSRTADVQEMVRRLRDAGASLVGVILNKVAQKRNGYGYGYGFGYGHYGGEADETDSAASEERQIAVS